MGCNASTELKEYNIPDPHAKEIEGETIVHINNAVPNIRDSINLIENTTTYELIQQTFKKYPNHEALGYRKSKGNNQFENHFTWFTYKQFENFSNNVAQNIKKSNLISLSKFEDQEGDFRICGIFARNCVEWLILDTALQSDSITSVTFYATLGAESFDHIFNQTLITTIAVSPENVKKLLEYHKKYNFKTLKNVIVFDITLDFDTKEIESLKSAGLECFLLSDFIKEPSEKFQLQHPKPNDIITICYTSGTTSLPKGALLTQKGFATQKFLLKDTGIGLSTEDVFISYLPAAHVMERVHFSVALFFGGRLGFITGLDVKKYLMEDLPILKPTILITVPKILINFQQKVLDTFDKLQGCGKSLAAKALRVKRENYESNHDIYHSLYDKMIFRKVREKFGGKVRYLVSGSAPVPRDVSKDIKIFLSAPLIEGYGMTELNGGSTGTHINDFTNSNVGGVLRTLFLKLVDKKELNYNSKTLLENKPAPTGEICFKGPSVFVGYFRDQKNTNEAIDKDGWLHTGDVGMIEPNNKGLKIIDRVKEIFKLSQGEYIAPAKLEGSYNKSIYVNQLCIYGNSLKSNIVAIIVVNKEKCKHLLVEQKIMNADEDLQEKHLKDPKLIEGIKASFDEIAKFSKFNSLEKPLNFILTFEEFSIANELLTPTMKLVRKKIQQYFQKEIDLAYG